MDPSSISWTSRSADILVEKKEFAGKHIVLIMVVDVRLHLSLKYSELYKRIELGLKQYFLQMQLYVSKLKLLTHSWLAET